MHSSGIQNQPKKLCWGELELIKQEQQLLRQENEQRQREFQGAKSELSHSREKVNWNTCQVLICRQPTLFQGLRKSNSISDVTSLGRYLNDQQ